MSLQGPLVVITEEPAQALIAALGNAGAFPVIETKAADAATALHAALPSAIVLAQPHISACPALAEVLTRAIAPSAPLVPIVACLPDGTAPAYRDALPVPADAEPRVISGRLSAALRIRMRHDAVLRRAEAIQSQDFELQNEFPRDPLDESIVIVAGRGRSYPSLAVAVGERAGLIGALSIETAAQYLRARDIDGLVIGDGFAPQKVEALLMVLSEDASFRDLPVALLGEPDLVWQEELPGLIQAPEPADLLTRFFPFVRMHAFDARLKRMMASFDLQGMIDPGTGLMRFEPFVEELSRTLRDATERGHSLSIARFAFPDLDRRSEIDAARLVSRLVRNVDFACREEDGGILVVFTETDLRQAHIVARRLAAILKHTMLRPDNHQPIAPNVTLATRKSTDNVGTLLARVTAPAIAA